MPLDPMPSPEGNVLLVDGIAVVLAGDELALARESGAVLRLAHFASCPDAGRFRRPKGEPIDHA